MEAHWTRVPATRLDSRAFLTARLVDLLVGDWDRHRGQWRWARIPGHEKWQPIPEDRDQAFVRFEGLIVNAGRVQLPQFVSFGDKYPGIDGLTWNGRDGDRRLLVDLEKPMWDEVAREVQARITDDVIADAVARLPDEYRELEGAAIEKALRDRRDALLDMADRFYRFLAKDVDLHATDEVEVASVKRDDNGDVEVAFRASGSAQPYLRRVFHVDETKEVRLYMAGGADSVVARGGDGKIKVRVIGGHGDDFVDDGSGVGLRVSDADSVTVLVRGDGTHLDDRPYTMPTREKAPWIPPRDWGRRNIFYPFIGGNTDLGVLFLLGWQSDGYGFRKDPYADEHTVRVAYATNAGGFGGDYRGEFRRENSRAYSGLYVRASGLDFLHFYGYGNESQVDRGRRLLQGEAVDLSHRAVVHVPDRRTGDGDGARQRDLRQDQTGSQPIHQRATTVRRRQFLGPRRGRGTFVRHARLEGRPHARRARRRRRHRVPGDVGRRLHL